VKTQANILTRAVVKQRVVHGDKILHFFLQLSIIAPAHKPKPSENKGGWLCNEAHEYLIAQQAAALRETQAVALPFQ
jgi:hypothetical protein